MIGTFIDAAVNVAKMIINGAIIVKDPVAALGLHDTNRFALLVIEDHADCALGSACIIWQRVLASQQPIKHISRHALVQPPRSGPAR
jgi:hypothetical protein